MPVVHWMPPTSVSVTRSPYTSRSFGPCARTPVPSIVRWGTRRDAPSVTELPLGIRTSTLSSGTAPDDQFAGTFQAPLAAEKTLRIGQPVRRAPFTSEYCVGLAETGVGEFITRVRTGSNALV